MSSRSVAALIPALTVADRALIQISRRSASKLLEAPQCLVASRAFIVPQLMYYLGQ
jgi:hypothetical protein